VPKPRQPSKLDDYPLIPLADFEGRMREVLSDTPDEAKRREAEYQREQAERRRGGLVLSSLTAKVFRLCPQLPCRLIEFAGLISNRLGRFTQNLGSKASPAR